jgi:transcription elongation factor GreA
MDQRVPMTPRGYEAMKQELQRLKSVERPANIKDIEEAIAHGDLSENAEYHAAKEKQAHIAGKMAMLDDRIARAQVIDTTDQSPDKVRFGATVKLSDIETDDEVVYTILGEDEADAKQGRISVTSPVAQALMGKEVGDEVTVKVPKGVREFEVLEIRFDPL